MPYNTRRKSLSLPSLGIHVPVTHAARAAAAAAAAAAASAAATSRPSSSTSSSPEQHVSKKIKRSHSDGPSSPSPGSPRKEKSGASSPVHASPFPTTTTSVKFELEQTPPRSPIDAAADDTAPSVEMEDSNSTASQERTAAQERPAVAPPQIKKVNLEEVNDDIVEAVIVQLQETGNRPHHVKELATVLLQQLRVVQQSANPCAIISSRLATYFKRPCWTAESPCPLAKELETVHPRRTYYYLSTCPHQPLPEPVSPSQKPPRMHVQPRRPIVSPAMSVAGSQSAAPSSAPSSIDETDSTEDSRRRELSPSPEIDLSSPELDDMDDDFYMPGTPMGGSGILDHPHHRLPHILGAGALSAAHGASRSVSAGSNAAAVAASHRRRGPSPPLEKDEREFTQTADGLQQRRRMTGGSLLAATPMSPTRAGADQQLPSLQMDERMDLDVEDIFAGDDESKTPSAASRSTLVVTMAGQRNPSSPTAAVLLSSPAILPLIAPPLLKMGSPGGSVNGDGGWAKLDAMLEWDRSPEDVELEELDCLLDEY